MEDLRKVRDHLEGLLRTRDHLQGLLADLAEVLEMTEKAERQLSAQYGVQSCLDAPVPFSQN